MFKKIFFLIFLFIPVSQLAAQIIVEITPVILSEGLAQIENMVNSETGDTSETIEGMISEYTEKPLLFAAMNEAHISTANIISPYQYFSGGYSIYTGTSAAITAESMNFSELSSSFETFSIEEDLYFGAAFQGFSAGFSFPADFLIKNLDISAGFGYSSFYYDEINLSSANINLGVAYTLFARKMNETLEWNGLCIQTGAGWSSNSVNTVYTAEDITQSFSLDPDGAGPVVPFDVTIRVSPEIDITYRNSQFSIPLALATGIKIFKIINLGVAAGIAFTFGTNSIGVSVDDEIEVQGYLSGLVEEAPRIVVSGTQTGSSARIITPFTGGNISFNLGGLILSIPVCWDFRNTLTAGFTLGAEF